MNRNAHTCESERGQSLVEVAVSVTFLMLLVAGIVDFGIAFFSYVALQDAAQEGAIYGSINPTDTAGIIERVRSSSAYPVDLSDTSAVQVEVSILGEACQGGQVKVVVSYAHSICTPFLSAILGSQTIPITASMTDTILQPPCP